MQHLESVERTTDTLSRWRARGPGGKVVEWNAEIINEVPNKVIGWRSIEGSDVVSAGSVNFEDAGPGRGTHVQVHLQYSPPGGKVGRGHRAVCSDAMRPARFAKTCAGSNRLSKPARSRPRRSAERVARDFDESPLLVRHERRARRAGAGPEILNPRDAIVKVTLDRDLRLGSAPLDGFIPTMKSGDILGHEFMGEVVEVGRENHEAEESAIASSCRSRSPAATASSASSSCGRLLRQLEPERLDGGEALRLLARRASSATRTCWAATPAARPNTSGCRSPTSGRSRCPTAADEQVLFLSDIFPTGYMAAENCNIKPGDTVAVWGCGPVGQFAIQSAWMLGAGRVIAIDREPERLRMAASQGQGRDHQLRRTRMSFDALAGDDRRTRAGRLHRRRRAGSARHRQRRRLSTTRRRRPRPSWRPTGSRALRQAIHCCRKGGTVSVPGVYGGFLDKMPFGAAFQQGAQTLKMARRTCTATCGR